MNIQHFVPRQGQIFIQAEGGQWCIRLCTVNSQTFGIETQFESVKAINCVELDIHIFNAVHNQGGDPTAEHKAFYRCPEAGKAGNFSAGWS